MIMTLGRAICARGARRRTLRSPGRLWRARPVRRSLTAGRAERPAGYSGLSGRAAGAARRARTSRGCAPQRASQGEGRRPSPYVIPTSVWHGFFGRTPVRSVVNRQAAPAPGLRAQPVFTQRPPHYLRRSRLKFFAEAFFQKSRKVFRRGLFSKRSESFSPRPFFKKAGAGGSLRRRTGRCP